MLRPFQLHQADSVAGASALLKEYGEDAKAYCGGTELLLVMKAGFLRYNHLVDVKTIDGLKGIRYDSASNRLIIGATTTHREVELSPVVAEHVPILAEMERLVANVRVRSQGTIGGNLCFAEPHSDPATLLLVLEAELAVEGSGGQRTIAMGDFLVDAYETSLEPDEILTEIRVPKPPQGSGVAYKKFGIYERPTLGVAAMLVQDGNGVVQEARIAVGCVGPKPHRLPEAEERLKGATAADFEAKLQEAAEAASAAVDPVDDLHGSAEYKRHLVGVFVRRTVTEARERIGG